MKNLYLLIFCFFLLFNTDIRANENKMILELEHGLWGIDDKRSKLIGRENTEPIHGARIFDMFEEFANSNGHNIRVIWRVDEEDDNMRELGEEFAEDIENIKFEIVNK